jgi:hypothetical protein
MRKQLRSVLSNADKSSRDRLRSRLFDTRLKNEALAYLDYTVGSDGFVAAFRFRGKWQKVKKSARPATADELRGAAPRSDIR